MDLSDIIHTQAGLRLENEKYIRAHPELGKMIRSFIQHTLRERPDDVTAHARAFFSRSASDIQSDIDRTE